MTIEFSVKSGSPEKQRTGCVVLPIAAGRKLPRTTQAFDSANEGIIKQFLKKGDIEGECGDSAWLYPSHDTSLCDRVLLVGVGHERDVKLSDFKSINETAANAIEKSGATEAVSFLATLDARQLTLAQMVKNAVLGVTNATYQFKAYKTDVQESKRPLRKFTIAVARRKDLATAETALEQGLAISAGVAQAKDLANSPPNICNPGYLAEQAKDLETRYRKLKTDILDETELEAMGMGAFVAVSKGSAQPGKLIAMKYTGAARTAQPLVFVGKGVTFDTGGISIKPSNAMDEMKFDMGGAASVFGVIVACAELQLPVNVIGIVAAAENMPDGNASRPGDIVKTLSGQTVEILNTDAEGRLVLCDALSYVDKYKPAYVIDIATLTGACIVALGHLASGMLCNDEKLGEALKTAAKQSDDRIWELPLWDEYGETLKSNFADMANIGDRAAGTITAAIFLSRFAKDYCWAHLDIAGTAWKSGKEKGATGRPVPLLMEWILQQIDEQS